MQLALNLLWLIWQIQDRIVRSRRQLLPAAGTAPNYRFLLTIATEFNNENSFIETNSGGYKMLIS
jgi:hypothetical protein